MNVSLWLACRKMDNEEEVLAGVQSDQPEVSSPAAKRPKTLLPALTISSSSPPAATVPPPINCSEVDDGSIQMLCGICLSVYDQTVRGEIDCCDHFFCFICILEWSKVESRCPLCKRRFSSITRSGSLFGGCTIPVPVRDQGYRPAEDEQFDPYADTLCRVCHDCGDDALLLLCDLCDSAAHTYCVGLGMTVPESEWFCPDCAHLRHAYMETDSYGDLGRASGTISSVQMDINDIVREENKSSSCSPSSLVTADNDLDCSSTKSKDSNQGPRTLSRCRDLHKHIRNIRDNWDALRHGSLMFPSKHISFQTSLGQSKKYRSAQSSESGEASVDYEASTSGRTTYNETSGGIYGKDIARAWKMMDKAKSMQRGISIGVGGAAAMNKPKCKTASFSKSRAKDVLGRELDGVVIGYDGPLATGSHKDHKARIHTMNSSGRKSYPLPGGPKSSHPVICKNIAVPSRANIVQKSSSHGATAGHCASFLQHVSGEATGPGSRQLRGSCPVSYSEVCDGAPAPEMNLTIAKIPELGVVQCNLASEEKERSKSQIQSLVKLNLKVQAKDKLLDVNQFKEIAWHATHTILAACGLEHTRSQVRPYARKHCIHAVKQMIPASIMPGSCRECFSFFVGDVVRDILIEKASARLKCKDRAS